MDLWKDLSKGKLLGHPIHVMLVHFPIAIFPVSLIFDMIAFIKDDSLFSLLSFFLISIGTGGGYLAAFFGMVDLISLPDEKRIWKKAIIHASLNGTILFSYTIIAALLFKNYPQITIPTLLQLILNAGLNLLLITGAYWGGDLILRHKVGVIED